MRICFFPSETDHRKRIGDSPSPRPQAIYWATIFAALATVSGCAECGPDQLGPATRRDTITLRVASEFQANLPVLGTTLAHMSSRLNVASNGTLKLNIYYPDELVPKLESLDAVSERKVDVAYAAAGFWAGKLPAAPLFSSIPFGPEIGEYLAWMYQGNGMRLYQQMYDRAGYHVKVFICAVLPPETSGWFAKPIRSPADLKGLNMRFYGLGGRVMEKMGVAVTLLSSAEIFQALERGVIDATEYSLPTIDQKLGFHQIVKYNYYPGWHQQTTLLELLINKDVWNGLSPAHQMLLDISCRDGVVHSTAEAEGTQFQAMRDNLTKYGVKQMYWPDEMIELFRKTWGEVAVEQCERDEFFKQVYDDFEKFRENYDLWERNAFLPRTQHVADSTDPNS